LYSNWITSPGRDENDKYLKPPTSFLQNITQSIKHHPINKTSPLAYNSCGSSMFQFSLDSRVKNPKNSNTHVKIDHFRMKQKEAINKLTVRSSTRIVQFCREKRSNRRGFPRRVIVVSTVFFLMRNAPNFIFSAKSASSWQLAPVSFI